MENPWLKLFSLTIKATLKLKKTMIFINQYQNALYLTNSKNT